MELRRIHGAWAKLPGRLPEIAVCTTLATCTGRTFSERRIGVTTRPTAYQAARSADCKEPSIPAVADVAVRCLDDSFSDHSGVDLPNIPAMQLVAGIWCLLDVPCRSAGDDCRTPA